MENRHKNNHQNKDKQNHLLRDLVIIIILAILTLLLSVNFKLHKRIDNWLIAHEGRIFPFDEFFVVLAILAICFAAFYFRRWHELKTEINKRKLLEEELKKKRDDLEVRVQKRTFELSKANVELQEEILEHKKKELEVLALKQQIEFVLGATKTGLDIIDSQYNIRYIDPEWAKVYGDYRGKKCYEYFMGTHQVCAECGITKAFQTKETVVTEESLAKEDNRPIEVITIPYKDVNGEWLVAEVNIDIAEHKHAEAEIKKYQDHLEELLKQRSDALLVSELRFRRLFESAKDGIILLNAETGQIEEVNPFMIELLGYSREEFLGKKLWDIGAFKNIVATKKAFFELQVKEYVRYEDLPLKASDGRIIEVEFVSNVYLVDHQRIIQCNIRDISERKRLQKKAEEVARIKSEFAAVVSHELRTPLASIKEGVSVVLDGVIGIINEEQKKFLNLVKKNVDRLDRLINNVLDFERLESGKIEFNFEKNDINQLVAELNEAMRDLIEKKGLGFITKLDEGIPRIKFDKDRIFEVLYNLVNNAIKFTPQGSITIITRKGRNFIYVSVGDTGVGVKDEDRAKLFQKFMQLHRIPGGAGLGLAISKDIIKAHKGRIWARSKLGKGSVFSFILPIK